MEVLLPGALARQFTLIEGMNTGLGSRQPESQPAAAPVDVTNISTLRNTARSASGFSP
jgi:hypothetical protein